MSFITHIRNATGGNVWVQVWVCVPETLVSVFSPSRQFHRNKWPDIWTRTSGNSIWHSIACFVTLILVLPKIKVLIFGSRLDISASFIGVMHHCNYEISVITAQYWWPASVAVFHCTTEFVSLQIWSKNHKIVYEVRLFHVSYVLEIGATRNPIEKLLFCRLCSVRLIPCTVINSVVFMRVTPIPGFVIF